MTLHDDQPAFKSSPPILDLREAWGALDPTDRLREFTDLGREEAEDFFLSLKPHDQAELVLQMPQAHRRRWVMILAPDDLTDMVQELTPEEQTGILDALDAIHRKEVLALLAYAEDEAGGRMNPRFARVRPDMRVDEALRYVRKQAVRHLETTRYIYVLDNEQKLLGVVSLRQLFAGQGENLVSELMRSSIVSAAPDMPQEELSQLFSRAGLMAIPVVDVEGVMQGIVTVDDIVDVVEEEATEDIHRLGAVETLDEPYLKISLIKMIKKRAGWLTILFVGEMFTATAMSYYEKEIERAVVLALFIPLIISSGGNSGSQASTLVVRAIALGEVRLRDWWKVFARELLVGSVLGFILGMIGLARIMMWPKREIIYGAHYNLVAVTVATSLIGIVLWGSLSGSMLPFILKKFRLDPATASAPFVATLVDVSGLVIYFTVANFFLRGVLL